MRFRIVVFCVLAIGAAALFVRLGVWQVSRLHERQAYNENFILQQSASTIPFAVVPRDTAKAHLRRVQLSGTYDFEHEVVLAPRTRNGSPGVDILTPLRITGSDTAVIVNRGWVYSPDAATVDLSRWREKSPADVTGYVQLYAQDSGLVASQRAHVIRQASRKVLSGVLALPIADNYVVATGDTSDLTHPARRSLPQLDEGPHFGYAVQWFSFAVISIVGAGIVLYRERQH